MDWRTLYIKVFKGANLLQGDSIKTRKMNMNYIILRALGLVKIGRMALHKHYPKMTQDGFEALFSR